MNQWVTLLTWLIAGPLFAQSGFQPGYIIRSDGERYMVDIHNDDWVDNPTRIRYRDSAGETHTVGTDTVSEFGIQNGSLRYLAATVRIDISSDRLTDLSQSAEPEFREQRVFLEYLIDGEADLFSWEAGETRRFFYRFGEDVPVQLIRRRYQRGNEIVDQDSYRGQLRAHVNCDAPDGTLRALAYDRRQLVAYFEEFNECRGVDVVRSVRASAPGRFRLYLRPGVAYYFGDMLADNGFGGSVDWPLEPSYGVSGGLGAEITLPFASNRWAMFGEVYLQRVSTGRDTTPSRTSAIRLRSVNIPLGVRRYVYLKGQRALFVDVLGLLQLPWSSYTFATDGFSHTRSYDASWNFGVGVGLGLRSGRWMAEARYTHDQDVLQTYVSQSTFYRSVGIVAGYQLNR